MKNNDSIEEKLKARGEGHRGMSVPEELETRLIRALNGKSSSARRRGFNWMAKAAAILLITVIIGYNFNTLAYYGKRLVGYDNIMSGTLKELNQLGKGQIIDLSHTFENGASVTLDGVMIDENQLLAFYTIKDPGGNAADLNIKLEHYIKGFLWEYYASHGQGEVSEDGTEIKWISSYAPPGFWERSLSLKFVLQEGDIYEEKEFTFKIDREKAMAATLKKNLNISLKQKETSVEFLNISATPTNTVVEGRLQNTFDLAKDHIMGERIRPKAIEFKLIANGMELMQQAGGMSTNLKGITFHKEFDALPKDLETLELQIDSIIVDHDVEVRLMLDEATKNGELQLLDQSIEVDKLYTSDGTTHVTITTLEDVLLSKVYLLMDGKKVSLTNTTTVEHIKTAEGEIYHRRTLNFPGTAEKYELLIESISFMEEYNKTVIIPID